MIRQALLALLADEAKYGYKLKSEFEAATGSAWVLNVGQVYSTLSRMERDGAIVGLGEDDEGRPRYEITAEGRAELRRWLDTAVERSISTRDEVTMKVLMAAATGVVDPREAIAVQRAAAVAVLQQVTATRSAVASVVDRLHLERLIGSTNAELRWLDIAEATIDADPEAFRALGDGEPEAGAEPGAGVEPDPAADPNDDERTAR